MTLQDVTTTASALDAQTFTATLAHKTQDMVDRIECSAFWQTLSYPDTPAALVAAVIKYTLLETYSYGPLVTEATFRAIGRVPSTRLDLMRPMVSHVLSEVDHCEMALADFIKLGGDEAWARSRRITPASLAMGAMCLHLAEHESPFAYLGYMFLFESVTPIIAQRLQRLLAAKEFPTVAQHFIDLHATEDVKHTDILTKLVQRVVASYPEVAPTIAYAADCFATVWPLPIWDVALANARVETPA
jgi:hypothetical protein